MQNKAVLSFFIVLLLILLVSASNKQTHHSASLTDITYCNIDSHSEQMDIYFPPGANKSDKKYPAVMYVHGGAWVSGDKQYIWGEMQQLPQMNFVFVSMNYTLAPPVAFPLNVEEVACAVRYLRSKAAEYHIDANRIALLGESAGGQLAALEAVSAKSRTFDVGPYLDYSSQVQAVVDVHGPADLTEATARKDLNDARPHLIGTVFGDEANLPKASPALHVGSGEPPFLIVQGDSDEIVPLEQSVKLYNALYAHGNKAQLITVKNADHAFAPVNPDQPVSPAPDKFLHSIVAFLKETLQ